MNQAAIVQKLWNYCNVLRGDGMSYGDYPGSSPGRADTEAAPRQLLPALLYLLHPCSRAHPCARPLSAPASRGITTSLYGTAIRTSCSAQLTYLFFLKMADERTRQLLLRCSTSRHPWRSQAPYNQKSPVPEKYSWPSLIKKDGDELFDHYRHTLEALGNQKGLLGLI